MWPQLYPANSSYLTLPEIKPPYTNIHKFKVFRMLDFQKQEQYKRMQQKQNKD